MGNPHGGCPWVASPNLGESTRDSQSSQLLLNREGWLMVMLGPTQFAHISANAVGNGEHALW